MLLRFFLFFPAVIIELTWGEAETLSAPATNASEAKIASAPNQIFVAAWVEEGVVKAAAKPPGGSWGLAETVSGSGASALQLAMDGIGNAIAIWVESGLVKTARLPTGESWGAQTTLSGAGGSSPQIALNASGDAVAIWIEEDGVKSKTRLYGENWQNTADVLAASGDSPQIAIRGNKAAAVWNAIAGSVDTIFASQKPISGLWSAASQISGTQYNCSNPQIAIDPYGNLLAAWFRYSVNGNAFSNVCVQSTYATAGQSWLQPIDNSNPGIRNPADLMIKPTFNSLGLGLLSWTNSYDGALFSVEGAVRGPGGWTPTVTFLPTNVYAYALSMCVDPSGFAYLTYMEEKNSAEVQIQSRFANTYSALPNYSAPIKVSCDSIDGFPCVASAFASGVGQIGAVWLRSDGMHSTVQAAIGTHSNTIPALHNLTIMQSSENMGLFTECMNTVSWKTDPPPEVRGINFLRNNQLIYSFSPDTTTFVDRNQTVGGPVSYGVAYFISNGDQGPITTASFP